MIAFPLTIPTVSRKTRSAASAASPNHFVTIGEDGDDFRQRLGCPRSPAKVSPSHLSCNGEFVSNINDFEKTVEFLRLGEHNSLVS